MTHAGCKETKPFTKSLGYILDKNVYVSLF